jgi:hypothetical protein
MNLKFAIAVLLGVFCGIVDAGSGEFKEKPKDGIVIDPAWTEVRATLADHFPADLDQLLKFAQREADEPVVQAQTCLSLAAGVGRPGGERYRSGLVEVADRLVEGKDLNGDGLIGWGISPRKVPSRGCPFPGMIDAFSDGTCNEANTEYMFETGLATMCLARAYLVTGERRFLQVAEQALESSWNLGVHPDACPECFYYWYSYHPNDRGRFVRNTNALMGASAAWVWKADGNPRYRKRAEEIAAAEIREGAGGNYGYFGLDDPQYKRDYAKESQRMENHIPWITKSMLDIGRILGNSRTRGQGNGVQRAWQECRGSSWTCTASCEAYAADPKRCRESVTGSPCFFKAESRKYLGECIAAIPTLLHGGLTPTMWWELLDR